MIRNHTDGASTSSIECSLKFCTKKEGANDLLGLYEAKPISFNLSQAYTLIEMLLGFNYGDELIESKVKSILDEIHQRDKTDTFDTQMNKFAVMRMDSGKRKSALNSYMMNESSKYSAKDMSVFAEGFTSRFLPIELKREYYDSYFESLTVAVRNNSGMYNRVGV